MKSPDASRGIGASVMPLCEKVPVLAHYAKTRGWYYVIGWLHRLTGIGLVIALTFHMYISASFSTLTASITGLNVLAWPIFGFLAWVASVGLGFHALNGGRLILYELFGTRNDAVLMRWTFGLCIAYALLCMSVVTAENRGIPGAFWGWAAFAGGVVVAYGVAFRMGRSRHSLLWKLQRISGAFLFITAPAYLLFSYLNPAVYDVGRMPDASFWFIVFACAVLALYHAGYGLFSIVADYVASGMLRRGMITLIVAVITALMYWAFRLTSSMV